MMGQGPQCSAALLVEGQQSSVWAWRSWETRRPQAQQQTVGEQLPRGPAVLRCLRASWQRPAAGSAGA